MRYDARIAEDRLGYGPELLALMSHCCFIVFTDMKLIMQGQCVLDEHAGAYSCVSMMSTWPVACDTK